MNQKTKNYLFQYKALFYLSWACLYFIFPTWISLHSILQSKGLSQLSDPLARTIAIMGLTIYFSISAYVINRYFSTLLLDKPVIIKINNWFENLGNHLWLVIVCSLSVVLHIYPLSLIFVATGGGETPYISLPLRTYDALNSYWYRAFDIPPQYLFWSIITLIILITKQTKITENISAYFSDRLSEYKPNKLKALFYMICIFALFYMYSYLFPYYSFYESLHLLRYPPVYQYIYLINYYAFGFSYMGPRIVQLVFCIVGAIYLYRTILLFCEKETALLGAAIYLFSPIIFSYASRAALASGTVFFMIIISFYFLRYIKDEDARDLILASFFIGLGFMYKRVVLVMLIICFAYLVFSRIKKRDWHLFIDFKILLLSLITILPFYMLGKSGLNFYNPALSSLLSYDSLFQVIQSQLSALLSFLLLLSIGYIFFKRDDLSLFYGFCFITYYIFFNLESDGGNQRYTIALYPAIAVLLAQFLFSIAQRIRWKHTFKLFSFGLAIYLIFLCLVPRASTDIITFRYKDFESQYYPIEKATDWIREKTGKNEKVLMLVISNYKFYIERIYEETDTLNPNRFIFLPSREIKELTPTLTRLKEYAIVNKVSYLMFPFSPKGAYPPMNDIKEILAHLKENKDNEFREAAIFNFEDNYIIIYAIKEDSVKS